MNLALLVILLVVLIFVAGAALVYIAQKRKPPISSTSPAPIIPLEPLEPSTRGEPLRWAPHLDSRFVECGGDRIHYVQVGKGPDLVLLHGIGASIFTWRFVINEFAKHFRVTALDLPGFGRSSKRPGENYGLDKQRERILSFLDTLGIEQTNLIGSSMGGAIALWLARNDPQRFTNVVVLAPATSPNFIPHRVSRLVTFTPFAHKTVNRSTMRLILNHVVGHGHHLIEDTVTEYLEPYLDRGESVKTFIAALQLIGDPRLPSCFGGIESRVLVVYGEKDRMVSKTSVQRLLKLLPHAEYKSHPKAGHHIMECHPEWTIEQIIAFLRPPSRSN